MSSYNTFAVTGAGNIGGPLIANLLLKKTVVILSRSSSTKVEGAETRVVDYDKPETLATALKGVDVVMAALGIPGGAAQEPLAVAAKKAGVSLFAPTEFGNPTHGKTGKDVPILIRKKALFHGFLKKLDLPYILTYTGPFETVLLPNPEGGRDLPNGKFAFVGKGDTQINFTTRQDIGFYLAKALVETPDSDLAWSTLRLQSDSKSFNEVVSLWEEKIKPGSRVEVTRTSIEDAEKIIAEGKEPAAVFTWLFLSWERGDTIYDVPSDSKRWPEYKPQSVEDVLRTLV